MTTPTTTTTTTKTRPGLLARLRNPRPAEVVQVAIVGQAPAVSAIARALAGVAVVTGIRHHVDRDQVHLDEPQIRLDLTVHPATRAANANRPLRRGLR